MLQVVLIGLFGAAGAICRHLTGLACLQLLGSRFAYGTLAVNVTGCFLLGLVMHLVNTGAVRLPAHTTPALTVGFLGALTTFSTFGYETVRHLERQEWLLAALNVAAHLGLGLFAAGAGLYAGRCWFADA